MRTVPDGLNKTVSIRGAQLKGEVLSLVEPKKDGRKQKSQQKGKPVDTHRVNPCRLPFLQVGQIAPLGAIKK